LTFIFEFTFETGLETTEIPAADMGVNSSKRLNTVNNARKEVRPSHGNTLQLNYNNASPINHLVMWSVFL
jgi:hypothetical protein